MSSEQLSLEEQLLRYRNVKRQLKEEEEHKAAVEKAKQEALERRRKAEEAEAERRRKSKLIHAYKVFRSFFGMNVHYDRIPTAPPANHDMPALPFEEESSSSEIDSDDNDSTTLGGFDDAASGDGGGGDAPQPTDTRSPTVRAIIFGVKFSLWLAALVLFVQLEFAAVFVCVSLLAFMWFNTRTKPRREGELSAYSVFNPNQEEIHGTFNAAAAERQLGWSGLLGF